MHSYSGNSIFRSKIVCCFYCSSSDGLTHEHLLACLGCSGYGKETYPENKRSTRFNASEYFLVLRNWQ